MVLSALAVILPVLLAAAVVWWGESAFGPVCEFDAGQVAPQVWVGSEKAAMCGDQALRARGITHVVSLLRDDMPAFGRQVDALENGLLHLPADDLPSFPLGDLYFDRAVAFIRGAVGKGDSVLVFCRQGVSRSAAIAAAYLIAEKGVGFEEAVQLMRRHRAVSPNSGFMYQLHLFEQRLRSAENG